MLSAAVCAHVRDRPNRAAARASRGRSAAARTAAPTCRANPAASPTGTTRQAGVANSTSPPSANPTTWQPIASASSATLPNPSK
jgi:hypothetical protein